MAPKRPTRSSNNGNNNKENSDPWGWVKHTKAEDIGVGELLTAYRLVGYELCCRPCERNCKENPRCVWGLGEKKWVSWLEDSSPSNEEPEQLRRSEGELIGLRNLGHTCYVNSLLQVWFHNPILRPAILKWRPPDENLADYVSSPSSHLQAIFARLKLSKQRSIDPSEFVEALKLKTDEQQDVQEFSKQLTSSLDKDLKKEILDPFTGDFQHETVCSTCQTKTVRLSEFHELELCVKKTLRDSLEQYLKEGILEGENQLSCRTCGQKRNAKVSTKIVRLPLLLNLQLMRYSYDIKTNTRKKVMTYMRYPEELDMSEFVSEEFKRPGNKLVYKLTAVAVHNGNNANSGHYVARIRDLNTASWFDCNDESITINTKMGKCAALSIPGGPDQGAINGDKKTECYTSNGAYMLLYTERTYIDNPKQDPPLHEYLTDLVNREDLEFENELARAKVEKEERRELIELFYGTKLCAPNNDAIGDLFTTSGDENTNGADSENQTFIITTVQNDDLQNLDFLPTKWFGNWFGKQTKVGEIGYASILCPHSKLCPPKPNETATAYRVVESSFVDNLYSKYGGNPRLRGREALCELCIQKTCQLIKGEIVEENSEELLTPSSNGDQVPSESKKFRIGETEAEISGLRRGTRLRKQNPNVNIHWWY